MATNFTLSREKAKHDTPKHYVVEREWKKESRKVAELEKELKEHEKTDAAHAHPMHRSHEAQGQPEAGIPALRK